MPPSVALGMDEDRAVADRTAAEQSENDDDGTMISAAHGRRRCRWRDKPLLRDDRSRADGAARLARHSSLPVWLSNACRAVGAGCRRTRRRRRWSRYGTQRADPDLPAVVWPAEEASRPPK
jgi:hypothetical protein